MDANGDGSLGETEADFFATWPELDRLPAASKAALASISQRVRFDAEDTVFTMGQEDGSVLYLVESGAARVTRAGGERGDIAVEVVERGQAVGLAAFARADQSLADAALQATQALTLIEVDAHPLRELGRTDGAVAMALLTLLARANEARRHQADPRARVFRHLIGLVRKEGSGRSISEMPRHAVLAEAAGVSDVEAASAIADLIAQGIARRAYPGLEVLDTDGLHRAAFAGTATGTHEEKSENAA